MGAEAYTWATKYKKNLVDALMAARMILLCFVCLSSIAIMAQEPELCVDPEAPLPEILKTAEVAVSRLEKLPSKTFIRSGRSDYIKVSAEIDIAYLDEQLLRFLILQRAEGCDALELKWRQNQTLGERRVSAGSHVSSPHRGSVPFPSSPAVPISSCGFLPRG